MAAPSAPIRAARAILKTKSPEIESSIALPGRGTARDVFCWIGHRGSSRHSSIPQLRADPHDAVTGIGNYIQRYQAMLAARQQDPEAFRRHDLEVDSLSP